MASYNEVQDLNSRTMPRKRGAEKSPALKSIEHERSANGGHVFTHRFHNDGSGFKEAETHTFGADEHEKAAEHFHKHADLKVKIAVKPEAEDGDENEGEDDEDSAAGAAY